MEPAQPGRQVLEVSGNRQPQVRVPRTRSQVTKPQNRSLVLVLREHQEQARTRSQVRMPHSCSQMMALRIRQEQERRTRSGSRHRRRSRRPVIPLHHDARRSAPRHDQVESLIRASALRRHSRLPLSPSRRHDVARSHESVAMLGLCPHLVDFELFICVDRT